jgi:hypothetical membrane protein
VLVINFPIMYIFSLFIFTYTYLHLNFATYIYGSEIYQNQKSNLALYYREIILKIIFVFLILLLFSFKLMKAAWEEGT